MEYIIIIAALAPIIAALIIASHNETLYRRSKKSLAASNPINIDTDLSKNLVKGTPQKNLSQKPWLVVLLSLLCMVYVLPEAMSSNELTRMALYKIVMGTGLFFFLLIQTSISNAVEAIYQMKSADIKLIKSFLTKINN